MRRTPNSGRALLPRRAAAVRDQLLPEVPSAAIVQLGEATVQHEVPTDTARRTVAIRKVANESVVRAGQ